MRLLFSGVVHRESRAGGHEADKVRISPVARLYCALIPCAYVFSDEACDILFSHDPAPLCGHFLCDSGVRRDPDAVSAICPPTGGIYTITSHKATLLGPDAQRGYGRRS